MGYFRQMSREKGEIGSVKKGLMKENTKKSKKWLTIEKYCGSFIKNLIN